MNSRSISLSPKWRIFFIAIFAFIISAGILSLFKEGDGGKTFFLFICLGSSYYSYRNTSKENWKEVSKGILIGIAMLQALILIIYTIRAAVSEAEWDFLCFYMQGLLGVHKLDFYDPNSFTILLKTINFPHVYSDSFKAEILDVGLLSPPITMLFFAPLASLDYETSRIVISILVFVFIIGNAILANRFLVKKERSVYSFLFFFILIMLLPGSSETILYNQTNFFLLFFLMLVVLNINKPSAGLYLALSLIIKPISGILILFFIFNKKWKPVIYFLVTSAVLLSLTGFIWGFHNIIGFITSSPTKRLPHYLYEQPINQSLIAVLNRNFKKYELPQNMIDLFYYFISGVLIVVTIIASKKLSKTNMQLSFLPFIPCMLMIYPSSLWHYMVYLLPVLAYFFTLKDSAKYFWIIIIPAFSFLNSEVFFTYLIVWGILLYIAFFPLRAKKINDTMNLNPIRL